MLRLCDVCSTSEKSLCRGEILPGVIEATEHVESQHRLVRLWSEGLFTLPESTTQQIFSFLILLLYGVVIRKSIESCNQPSICWLKRLRLLEDCWPQLSCIIQAGLCHCFLRVVEIGLPFEGRARACRCLVLLEL